MSSDLSLIEAQPSIEQSPDNRAVEAGQRKRGRPKKKASTGEQSCSPSSSAPPSGWSAALLLGLDKIIQARAPKWHPLTDGEAQAIALPLEAVLAKYSPALESWGPELALAGALALVVLPRLPAVLSDDAAAPKS